MKHFHMSGKKELTASNGAMLYAWATDKAVGFIDRI